MLTYIKIKGFESHVDSYYEFSPYFNLFVGESNSGKSSIIRAICVVCYNRWDESMLNGKIAEIELGTTKGYVKVRKGKNINDYFVYDKKENKTYEFQKIGKTVPEKVSKITGILEKEWTDITETPNVMFQLDKHYLISEIDGKKCSPNMFARVVDNVLGLGGVEDLIKDISSDGITTKRKYNFNVETIEKLKLKLHDKKLISVLKNKLSNLIEIKSKQNKLNVLTIVNNELKLKTKSLDLCIYRLSKISNNDNLSKRLDMVKNKSNVALSIRHIFNIYLDSKNKLKDVIDKINNICDIDSLKNKVNDLKTKNDNINNFVSISKTWNRLNNDIIFNTSRLLKIPDIKLKFNVVKNRFELYNNLIQLNDKIKYSENKLNQYNASLKINFASVNNFEIKLQKIKDKIEVCPLCGKKF